MPYLFVQDRVMVLSTLTADPGHRLQKPLSPPHGMNGIMHTPTLSMGLVHADICT